MAAKQILIAPHALFEMQRRGISQADLETVVRHPQQIVPSSKGRHIRQSRLPPGQMLLRAVVKEEAQVYHVITAYKTSKIAKYWKQP
ncbi:MAG: DUF4258 domain-containing protein [Verrucomicrobiia bacterium]